MKKCLIISENTAPVAESASWLKNDRAWMLAQGLEKANEEIRLAVAFREAEDTGKKPGNQKITISTWNERNLAQLIEGYDSIIISYSLTEASLLVIHAIEPNQQLIIDCRETPFTDFSSKEKIDLQRLYGNFRNKTHVWNRILRQGDIYLCDSQKGKDFYAGVLSSICRINPATYEEDNLLIVSDESLKEKSNTKIKSSLKKLTGAIISGQRSLEYENFGIVDLVNPDKGSNKAGLTLKTRLKNQLINGKGSRRLLHKQAHQSQMSAVRFFSHQLDLSGAPFIAMDLARDFKQKHPNMPLEFHTFLPKSSNNIKELNKAGIKPKVHPNKNLAFEFAQDDVVMLNTPAFSKTFMNSVYDALEKKVIKKLVWYIHEDYPELFFLENKEKIKEYLSSGRIVMFTPAAKIQRSYNLFFNTRDIKLCPYKLTRSKQHHQILRAKDFNELRFILTGSVHDVRKGQLPILYAFIEFKNRYFDKNPDLYRNFNLIYVGLDKDFSSKQILKHAKNGLGNHFKSYGKVSHEKSLELMKDANITICYSLMEALPLFVFEGMLAGHPILRNDSSGMEEQLENGKNGFYLDTDDFSQIVATIEKVANRKKTSNETLERMSARSYDIAKNQESNSYEMITKALI